MSSSNFKYYQEAANRVNRRWVKRRFIDEKGGECLVQSVLSATGLQMSQIPIDIIVELDGELSRYPCYRFMRRATKCHRFSAQPSSGHSWKVKTLCNIMFWNDAPWRRKKTVVKALAELGQKLEVTWLRDQHSRLTLEVSNLQAKVGQRQRRIKQLEAENSLSWKRLINARALKADKERLDELEQSLENKWAELKRLPELAEV